MTQIKYLLIGCLIFLFFSCEKPTKASDFIIISGKVINRDSTSLLLAESEKDLRYHGQEIEITDTGEFLYKLAKPEVMVEYQLVFKDELNNGVWRPILFYPDKDSIFFELYPIDKSENNKIEGGEHTKNYVDFTSTLTSKFESDYLRLSSTLDSLQRTNPSSPKISETEEKMTNLNNEVVDWQLNYFKDKPNIVSYREFLNLLKQREYFTIPQNALQETRDMFKTKFPDHPYTSSVASILNNVKAGSKYIDFSAPNKDGLMTPISSVVQSNKLTLLDLWAPWCGPCIKKSQEVLTVYDDLKTKDFEVIAVIGGIKDEKKYTDSLEKYNYPWPVLMEIQDEYKIWEHYSISNSGGSQFLINQEGTILAINPSIDQIKSFLH